jgi:hypothetical protein
VLFPESSKVGLRGSILSLFFLGSGLDPPASRPGSGWSLHLAPVWGYISLERLISSSNRKSAQEEVALSAAGRPAVMEFLASPSRYRVRLQPGLRGPQLRSTHAHIFAHSCIIRPPVVHDVPAVSTWRRART